MARRQGGANPHTHSTGYAYLVESSDDESETTNYTTVILTPQSSPTDTTVIVSTFYPACDDLQPILTGSGQQFENKSKQSQEPSLREWEEHRSVITHLYKHLNWRLTDVDKYMRKEYNFIAKEATYKRRLGHWNLRKNMKGDEALRYAAEIDHSPDPQSVIQNLALRGIKLDKMKRHLKRNGESTGMEKLSIGIRQLGVTRHDEDVDTGLTSYLSAFRLSLPEKVFRELGGFASYSLFECDKSTSDELTGSWSLWRSLYYELDRARFLFASDRHCDAVRDVDRACATFHMSIKKIIPTSIPDLVSCMAMLQEPDLSRISATIFEQFLGLTEAVNGQDHPCSLVLRLLGTSGANFQVAGRQVLDVWTEAIKSARRHDRSNSNLINAMVAVADARGRCGDNVESQRIYEEEIVYAKYHWGPSSDLERNLLGQLASNALQYGDHDKAEEFARSCLAMCQQISYHQFPCQFCTYYDTLLGLAAQSRGDLLMAAEIFWRILKQRDQWGTGRNQDTLDIFTELVDIYTKLNQRQKLGELYHDFAYYAKALQRADEEQARMGAVIFHPRTMSSFDNASLMFTPCC